MSQGNVSDEYVNELTEARMRLIGWDHHKDRDCHWSITKTWSYGEAPVYTVEHNGYVYSGLENVRQRKFQNYQGALTYMVRHLKVALRRDAEVVLGSDDDYCREDVKEAARKAMELIRK